MCQVFTSCLHTIRTLPALLPDPHNMEDVDSDMEDHLYDAIRYGLMSRWASHPERFMDGPQALRRGGAVRNAAHNGPGLEDW